MHLSSSHVFDSQTLRKIPGLPMCLDRARTPSSRDAAFLRSRHSRTRTRPHYEPKATRGRRLIGGCQPGCVASSTPRHRRLPRYATGSQDRNIRLTLIGQLRVFVLLAPHRRKPRQFAVAWRLDIRHRPSRTRSHARYTVHRISNLTVKRFRRDKLGSTVDLISA